MIVCLAKRRKTAARLIIVIQTTFVKIILTQKYGSVRKLNS